MTYCVAWKSGTAVFLAADAAVTSDERPRTERSSFGEKHAELSGTNAGRYVQEQTLKLYDLGCCAVTFAGCQATGYRILNQMEEAVGKGTEALQAFSEATQDEISSRKVQMALAFVEDGKPALAAFNHDGNGKVVSGIDRVQFGSMKDAYCELTDKYIDTFAGLPGLPQRLMVQTLALLQSYGIHDYLMEDGVGGGFCGVYVDEEGPHWQPDILYLLAHPKLEGVGMVGSFTRRNVWCLFSSEAEYGSILFAHAEKNESGELFRQRVSEVKRELELRHDNCQFDYVIVLNIGKHITSTIELLGNKEHRLIVLEPDPRRDKTIGVYWSPYLQGLFDTVIEPSDYDGPPHDLCVQWTPYQPPEENLSQEFRAELREEANQDTAAEG